MKQLETNAENSTPTNASTQFESAASEAMLLNALPTHLGAKLRDDMCFAYRGISIALANHQDYLDTLTRRFVASPVARFVESLRFGLAGFEVDND